jgi:hypothetical protein
VGATNPPAVARVAVALAALLVAGCGTTPTPDLAAEAAPADDAAGCVDPPLE